MKPNKEDTEKLFEIYSKQKGEHDPKKCALEFYKDKYEECKKRDIVDIVRYRIFLYEEKTTHKPKYIFMNPITHKQLRDYLDAKCIFAIARELGPTTEYFMGVKIIVCDIEDDEIIVGG